MTTSTATVKTTYVATAPDGSTFTRTSATRTYTHAVLVYGPSWNNAEPHWGYVSFNGTAELAVREAAKWATPTRQAVVVPVEVAKVHEVKPRAGRTACIGSGRSIHDGVTAEVWEAIKNGRDNTVPCRECGKEVGLTQWRMIRSHKG